MEAADGFLTCLLLPCYDWLVADACVKTNEVLSCSATATPNIFLLYLWGKIPHSYVLF